MNQPRDVISKTLSILILEDQIADAELCQKELRRAGLRFTIRRVETRGQFEVALDEFRPDLIISDFTLPGAFDGLMALELAQARFPEIPFVFVSGTIGEERAVEAVKRGAADYVLKDRMGRLGSAVLGALENVRLRREKDQVEATLKANETLYRGIFEGAAEGILLSTLNGYLLAANPAAAKMLGYASPEELESSMTNPGYRLYADSDARSIFIERVKREGEVHGYETRGLRKDGIPLWVSLSARLVRDQQGGTTHILTMISDISERKRAEAALLESEQRFRAIFDHAGIGISIRPMHDRAAPWTQVNDHFCRMLGYTRDELLKLSTADITPADGQTGAVNGNERLLSGDVVNYAREKQILLKDGRRIWVLLTVAALPGPDGRPANLIATYQDITGRKETEAALRESQSRFQSFMDHLPGRASMRDVEGRYTFVNKSWQQSFGTGQEKVLGRTAADLFPHDRASALQKVHNRAVETNNVQTRALQTTAPDGTHWWISTHFPIPDSQGRISTVGTIAIDITEQKRQEERIARLNRVRALLSDTNGAIARMQNRQELFEAVCRIAVEHGKFGIAWIGELDPEKLEITPVASAGLDGSDFLMHHKLVIRPDAPQRGNLIASSIRERRPMFSNDISQDAEVGGERRKEAIRRGYHSAIALPLMAESNVVGNFSLFAKEASFFDDEEVGLLTELASNISFALEHLARQEKIGKLSRIRAVSSGINAAIVRVRERDALLQETCRIANEHGKFEMVWVGRVDTGKQEVRPIAWSGFSPETARKVSWASISAAQGTLGEAVRTRKVAVRNDIEAQLPSGGMRGEAVNRGFHSTIALPLVIDDSVAGLIVLFAAGTGFFDKDELALLEEVAADVSFALQSIAKQEKVEYLSYYDPLTALPNRSLFVDRLSQQLHGRGGEQPMVAVILLNLERFRYINETLGRNGGDELLKLVAQRLESAFHGKDYLARIGADSFGMMIRGVSDTAAVTHALQDQVLGCFHEPLRLNDSELRVAVKAGVAVFPADGGDADTLFRNAEAALKKARESGERFLFYAAEMNARAAQVLTLETRLRKAVGAQEFMLHYQPKFELKSGRICGMEALIRWQDPASGLVAPGIFIPLLEETGLILEVGKWALGKALAQHREWTARGFPTPRIAVNVSPIQLQQKDFADVVISAVQEQGDNPDALELEVTESLLMKDVQASIRKLSILRGMGITVAMDDFGTGYSSLAYLARLPINSIKIDRSFIIGMAGSPQDMGIVTTIIALAHSMNLKVVAEGVETAEQSQLLKLLKCNEAQGYLFSKPLPSEQIEPLLHAQAQ